MGKGPGRLFFFGFVGDGMLPSYISIMESRNCFFFFFVAHVAKSREL